MIILLIGQCVEISEGRGTEEKGKKEREGKKKVTNFSFIQSCRERWRN